jgi:hypothetical protein
VNKYNSPCSIPFDHMGRESYFCSKNPLEQSRLECKTTLGDYSDCQLGKFLLFGPVEEITSQDYESFIEFQTIFNLEKDNSYELEVNFLINNEHCSPSDFTLSMAMHDDNYFEAILFDLSQIEQAKRDRWNNYIGCFNLPTNNYTLSINVTSACDSRESFIALDNVYVRKLSETSRQVCPSLKPVYEPDLDRTHQIEPLFHVNKPAPKPNAIESGGFLKKIQRFVSDIF